jgi:hypothetical protein
MTVDIEKIKQNQKPIQNIDQLKNILTVFFDLVNSTISLYDYRLVGTAAALIQNVEIQTGDIDILFKQREGIDAIHPLLGKCLKQPEFLGEEEDGQYLAIYEFKNVILELSTVEYVTDNETMECFGQGPWKNYKNVRVESYSIPVVLLELRLLSELSRGRENRIRSLMEYLQVKGCNLDLIQKGMEERNLDPEIRRKIIKQLNV